MDRHRRWQVVSECAAGAQGVMEHHLDLLVAALGHTNQLLVGIGATVDRLATAQDQRAVAIGRQVAQQELNNVLLRQLLELLPPPLRLHSPVRDHQLWPGRAWAVFLVDGGAGVTAPGEHPTLPFPLMSGLLSTCLPAAGPLCQLEGLPACCWGALPVGWPARLLGSSACCRACLPAGELCMLEGLLAFCWGALPVGGLACLPAAGELCLLEGLTSYL